MEAFSVSPSRGLKIRPTSPLKLADAGRTEVSWASIVKEAHDICSREDFLSEPFHNHIFKYAGFAQAICSLLAVHIANDLVSFEKLYALFISTYDDGVVYEPRENLSLETLGLLDLDAVRTRDPASNGLISPLLYFKGYKALQASRISHILWRQGRKNSALFIQSRCSELWSIDIHPAAIIGAGLLLDHGTGVVIGETSIIGTNCSFLHGVCLTGTGTGNCHPKLGNDILIGCKATILGNISIGSNSKIGSGSIVTKSLPCCVTAVGNPARIVGRSKDTSAASNMDLALKNVQ